MNEHVLPSGIPLASGKKPENTEETDMDMRIAYKSPNRQYWVPWSFEVAVLPTALLCYPDLNNYSPKYFRLATNKKY